VTTEHVLFVCTGNLCRSPLAEVLLRARLAARTFDHVVVSSAGTWAGSAPAPAEARLVATEHGGDLSGHRARRIDAGLVESADLVVGMTADHLIDVAHHVPGAEPRLFKLSELARLGVEHGVRTSGEPLRAYLARVGGGRGERVWGHSHGDPDVPDPFGETAEAYRRVAGQIAAVLDVVVEHVWPAPTDVRG
jgi:protein-tyrosine phosphatase